MSRHGAGLGISPTAIAAGSGLTFSGGLLTADMKRHEHKGPLAAAATTQTFSSLTGDTDGGYLLTARIKNAAADADIDLYINGVTTNMLRWCIQLDSAAAPSKVSAANAYLGTVRSGGIYRLELVIPHAHKRLPRLMTSRSLMMTAAGAAEISWLQDLQWNEATAEITSIGLTASVANGIGVDSEISLYKLRTL